LALPCTRQCGPESGILGERVIAGVLGPFELRLRPDQFLAQQNQIAIGRPHGGGIIKQAMPRR